MVRRRGVLAGKAYIKTAISFLMLSVLMAALSGCGGSQTRAQNASEAGSEPHAVSVEVTPALRGDLVIRVPIPGIVTAGAQVDLAFKAGGKVIEVTVKPGDRVKKGQVLARLDQSDILAQAAQAEAAVEAARANLASAQKGPRPEEIDQIKAHVEAARAASDAAQRNLERMKELYEAGAVPEAQFEGAQVQAESARQQLVAAEKQLELALQGSPEEVIAAARAQVKQAEAAATLARSQLEGSSIIAPFEGEVSAVNLDKGELVSPGMPVLTLVDPSGVFVSATVSESLSQYIHAGKEVYVRTKTLSASGGALETSPLYLNKPSCSEALEAMGYVPAVLTEVSPSADPRTKGFLVKAAIRTKSNSGSGSAAGSEERTRAELKPGVFAEILLSTETASNAVIVPRKAILSVESFDRNGKSEGLRWIAFVAKNEKDDEEPGASEGASDDRWIAEERVVELGVANTDFVEVTSGIEEGDLVVVTGQHFLENGCRVVIAGDGHVGGAD